MRHFLTGLRYLLAILSALALLTVVSVMPSNKWWVQVQVFPRLQVLALELLGWLALGWPARRGLLAGLGIGLGVQAFSLWPYLPFAPRAVPDAYPGATARLHILVINVLMTKHQDACLR